MPKTAADPFILVARKLHAEHERAMIIPGEWNAADGFEAGHYDDSPGFQITIKAVHAGYAMVSNAGPYQPVWSAILAAAREIETAAECVECSTVDQLGASVARLRRARLVLTQATNAAVIAQRSPK